MAEEDIEFITFDGDAITKSDYRDEIINKYIQAGIDGLTKITDFTIGSEAYHLADVMASFILEHRELIDLNYRMSMIHTAEGEFLDNFGDMVGVHRIGSSGSIGEVTFTRLGDDTTDAIVIADGSQVSTTDAISFIVDNDGVDLVIESGQTSVTADVICEQEGAYTNVLANTITLVMGDLGNLVSVTNANDFTEGEDIESDDDYRARILLSPYEVPTGSLAWYENLSDTLESVHDVKCAKGENVSDADVKITFNPSDWTDTVTRLDLNEYNEDNSIESTTTGVMLKARQDLIELFSMKEYDMVGITRDYHLCKKVLVLSPTGTVDYLFALLLETSYTIPMVQDDVIAKIQEFNADAMISVEFNPSGLSSLIENEVDGIITCRIVKKVDNEYTEITSPYIVQDDELYQVDTTDIADRIQVIDFNMQIEEECEDVIGD